MLSAIGRLIALTANLAEAEGRLLRANIARFATTCALAVVAFAFGVLGAVLLLFALFLGVARAQGYVAAAVVCGLVCVVVAGAIGWFISERRR